MRTSPTIGSLTKAMAAAQAEMKNAPLNKSNPHFKSRYADLAAIRDTTVPALSKHGLMITQVTGFSEHGLVLYTRLAHADGEWIESEYPLIVGNPQQMGSALTYARRYCLAAICGIAADEDDDANAASVDQQKESTKPVSSKQPSPTADTTTPAHITRGIFIADDLRHAFDEGGEKAVRRAWRKHEPEIKSFTSQKLRARLEAVFYELVAPPDDSDDAIADLEGRDEKLLPR